MPASFGSDPVPHLPEPLALDDHGRSKGFDLAQQEPAQRVGQMIVIVPDDRGPRQLGRQGRHEVGNAVHVDDIDSTGPDDSTDAEQVGGQEEAEGEEVQQGMAAREALDMPACENFKAVGTPQVLGLLPQQKAGLDAVVPQLPGRRLRQPMRPAKATVQNAVQHPDPWLVFRHLAHPCDSDSQDYN